tara:strand:- start:196 stop:879 length:684 start_codon:yes stop_codon:yes gene_type:complete
MKIKRLLIIPARAGSKRIKNKNIKSFYGKPIISYSINNAIRSKLFKTIHVSTDSLKIKKISEKYNIKVRFLRSKNLSNDKVGLIKVYNDVVKKFRKIGNIYDEIWFLTPCSPLISYKNLISASNFFKKSTFNSFLAVAKFPVPIEWAASIEKNYELKFKYFKNTLIRSQNLKSYYYDTGTFGGYKSNVFYRNKKIKYAGFPIDKSIGIDIDDIEDWNLALKFFKNVS